MVSSDLTKYGKIFDIQKFSLHDGPGIRTTVFLKGCPLKCKWCHNDEGLRNSSELSFHQSRCVGCGYCFSACVRNVHQLDNNGKHILDRERCISCGNCTKECYSDALKVIGDDVSVDDIMQKVLPDLAFYANSGGGITLSGGEPLAQFEFVEALLERAKEYEIHCCIDTCGFVDAEVLKRVMPYVDLFLYDIKETDDERHIEYTGQSNRLILSNLQLLHDCGADICLRLPIVPGYNDRQDHFEKIVKLARSLPRLNGIQILPFHRLGMTKSEHFGRTSKHGLAEPPAKEDVAEWLGDLCAMGLTVECYGASSVSQEKTVCIAD